MKVQTDINSPAPYDSLHNSRGDNNCLQCIKLLRSALAGHIYKLCANHTSNSGLTEPLSRAQAIFYALPNNERGTKYRRFTYSAKQNCPRANL